MIGSISVSVKNKKNNYTFTLNRNITILCGDSGRGKTTLFDMIYEFNRFGKNSGASVVCNVPVIALTGDNWKEKLSNISSSVVVIDEDSQFINSHDFAKMVLKTDNYYLLITRNYLSQLPYSVEEIYEIKGNKNKKFVRVYSHIDRMYDSPSKKTLPFVPEVIIVEDSKSGYQLFSKIANELGIECISSDKKYLKYNKSTLADYYLTDASITKIKGVMNQINLE